MKASYLEEGTLSYWEALQGQLSPGEAMGQNSQTTPALAPITCLDSFPSPYSKVYSYLPHSSPLRPAAIRQSTARQTHTLFREATAL